LSEEERKEVWFKTGISVLDTVLRHARYGDIMGISTQRFTLIEAPVDAEEIMFTIAKNIAKNNPNIPIVIVTSEEPKSTFPDLVASKANWLDFNEYGNILVIESYTRVEDTGSITGSCTRKMSELNANAGVLMIYSLSKLILFMEERELFNYIQALINNVVLRMNFALIANIDPPMHTPLFLARIRRTADLIIRVIVDKKMGFEEKFFDVEPITVPIRRPTRAYPYIVLHDKTIHYEGDIPKFFSTISMDGRMEKSENIITGIPPIDYRETERGPELRGIPPLFSYAFNFYESPAELYPFTFQLIDTMINVNNMNVIMLYSDDSPDTFFYEMYRYLSKEKIKAFEEYLKKGYISFINCSKGLAPRITELISKSNEPLEKTYVSVSDATNTTEVLYHLDNYLDPNSEYTKVRKSEDGSMWGPFVIFNTLSGITTTMGFENTYKFVSMILSNYIWRASGGYVFWFYVNPTAFAPDEWNKIAGLIDGVIETTSRVVHGVRRRYIRVVRIPKEKGYTTYWVPYIDSGVYPPGLMYLSPTYFGSDGIYRPRS